MVLSPRMKVHLGKAVLRADRLSADSSQTSAESTLGHLADVVDSQVAQVDKERSKELAQRRLKAAGLLYVLYRY